MGAPRSRVMLATICVCTLGGSVLAEAVTSRPSGRTVAKRALAKAGYTSLALKCKTKKSRTACTWNGVRALSRCDGKVVVAPKHAKTRARAARMDSTRCNPVLFGFNTYTNERTNGLQHKTGATVRRIIVPWLTVEPAPGVWLWGEFDAQYQAAIEAGLRPVMIATEAPCWARPRGGCIGPVLSGPPDPDHDADWREYVRQLADRYTRALAIEIWNEPNLAAVFWPKPDPVRYTQLLQQAYSVIKAAHPDMTVVSGGLLAHGNSGESFGGMGDLTFLRGMLAAGAANSMDALSLHPYPQVSSPSGKPLGWDPAVALNTMNQWRAIQAEYGISKHLWITEFGESTTSQAGFPAAVTPNQQAADLDRLMHEVVLARDVDVVIIHTLGDAPRDAAQTLIDNTLQPATGISIFYNGVNSGFGVFDSGDHPKPAACVLSRALGGTLSC